METAGCFLSLGLPRPLARDLAARLPIVELGRCDMIGPCLGQNDIRLAACPLIASAFDAFQVIETLADAGYGGRLLVVAPNLPNVRMVEQELRHLARGLSLTLISP